MTAPERGTFIACATGWALDGMDFMIYPLVLGSIMRLWQVGGGRAGLAATVTLLASAIGGWLAGFLSDRIGRVRTLQLTILWFSLFSLLSAFAQSFNQLLLFRTLLGFGFGGEWAVGAVLMGEVIRPAFRGRAVGSVQAGWALGWGAAVLAQAALFSTLSPALAWRAMFALGVAPALLTLYIRRHVAEPELAAASRRQRLASGEPHPTLTRIFAPDILTTTLLAALASTGAQGGYYAITTWLPTFLKTSRGLSVIGSTGYLATLISGSFAGYLVGAWLADRIGRRMLFLVFSAAAIVLVLAYTQLPIPNQAMLVLGFPLGLFASGYFSGFGPFLSELFPTAMRGSGQGFCYNFGRGVGALFPTLVGYLAEIIPLADAIAVFATVAYAVFFFAAFALPETRGRTLAH
ncbi:MAG: MFS transporter [Acidibrevibacterium sp.]|jgi:MFS family permease|uniref:MFS transporter n=1 Tax=Acidibrevibacterium fodinaquatile TaxID=1969806 RepID=UPI0023A8FDBF|nr:MFS transporter [Acidibrevibacterium fodinaquatile]MCA7119826.1 MFS transporter [Acidibrevibacterium fodinaquatile]